MPFRADELNGNARPGYERRILRIACTALALSELRFANSSDSGLWFAKIPWKGQIPRNRWSRPWEKIRIDELRRSIGGRSVRENLYGFSGSPEYAPALGQLSPNSDIK